MAQIHRLVYRAKEGGGVGGVVVAMIDGSVAEMVLDSNLVCG